VPIRPAPLSHATRPGVGGGARSGGLFPLPRRRFLGPAPRPRNSLLTVALSLLCFCFSERSLSVAIPPACAQHGFLDHAPRRIASGWFLLAAPSTNFTWAAEILEGGGALGTLVHSQPDCVHGRICCLECMEVVGGERPRLFLRYGCTGAAIFVKCWHG
jgi:hypothetical protein